MFKKIKDSYNFSVPVLSLTIFLKFSLDIFYDIFYGESFGDSIFFERVMLLTLFFSMGIHIYKNMNNHPEQDIKMKIRRKLYETTVLFNMVRITYVWNIFKKEKYC